MKAVKQINKRQFEKCSGCVYSHVESNRIFCPYNRCFMDKLRKDEVKKIKRQANAAAKKGEEMSL